MTRRERLAAWFGEASNLRRFALWNVWFWLANQVLVNVWRFAWPVSFRSDGLLYLNNISVAALWLSSLAWWQSTRVEERQIEAEDTDE